MGYLDQLPSKEEQVELIKVLQAVTEGKVCCCTMMNYSQSAAA